MQERATNRGAARLKLVLPERLHEAAEAGIASEGQDNAGYVVDVGRPDSQIVKVLKHNERAVTVVVNVVLQTDGDADFPDSRKPSPPPADSESHEPITHPVIHLDEKYREALLAARNGAGKAPATPDREERLIEGLVLLAVRAGGRIQDIVSFAGWLWKNPDFRFQQMVSKRDGVEISIFLRQPVRAKKILESLPLVSSVEPAIPQDASFAHGFIVHLDSKGKALPDFGLPTPPREAPLEPGRVIPE